MLGLAACATPFKADVQRFQSQLPAPTGETFAVVADDPELAGGLEFSQYADLVEAELLELGYTEATPEAASLLVRFDYKVDDGRERIRGGVGAFHDPFFFGSRRGFGRFGRFGSFGRFGRFSSFRGRGFRGRGFGRRGFRGGGFFRFGFYDPWLGGSSLRSVTIYNSGIDLKIDRAATGERVFEGNAQAVSTSNRLQHLVPNLVEAMFTDFPGNSGENLRITIKPEETKVRRIEQ
ncbi:MAG: DUF4136 domain-containing protein [Erythrobacter sp.]